MPNTSTSQFIRRVLQRSCSEEIPCEMCNISSTSSRGTSGSKRSEDQFSTTSSSATNSPRRTTRRPMTSARESLLMQKVKSIVPKLSTTMKKGECGRIAIFGGCIMYSGAPYFAAIAALKTGADLVHVFCEKEAGSVIKSYSPEMIVHPVLDQEYGMEEIDAWLPRLDCIVMGPGLGRNQSMLGRISLILEKVKMLNIPIVIDSDGLWHLMTSPNIIKGYTRAVITPNAVEFSRLAKVILNKEVSPSVCPDHKLVGDLARALGNLTVIHKGAHDVISDGKSTEDCHAGGSPRRCGGQGDILAGSLATFLNWAYTAHSCDDPGPAVIASWGACRLSRGCALQTYNQEGRAGTAIDIISQIHAEFLRIYESETFI
eukprot:GFUD01005000.1.p1 GENE.GFUD01005000.1~~GFUD01005000.1.p1  ORF type:complete len:373 (+),score=32.14 GFUD01005000.1:177-1295(+)